MAKRYVMVIKYVFREYVLCGTWYILHFTPYVGTLVRITWYVPCGLSDLQQTSLVLLSTWYMGICYMYEVRLSWISLYDFPPLASFQGLFAFVKRFCFLDLKIKNDWSFHFRNSNFSGKGNKGEYLYGCYFLGYIIIRCQC